MMEETRKEDSKLSSSAKSVGSDKKSTNLQDLFHAEGEQVSGLSSLVSEKKHKSSNLSSANKESPGLKMNTTTPTTSIEPPSFPLHNYLKNKPPSSQVDDELKLQPIKHPAFPLHNYLKSQQTPQLPPILSERYLYSQSSSEHQKEKLMAAMPRRANYKVYPNRPMRPQETPNDFENVSFGGKTKQVMFGPWGPFTFNTAPKLLQPLEQPGNASKLNEPSDDLKTNKTARKFVTKMSADECREALVRWANSKSCKSVQPAKECTIKRVTPYLSLMYKLESYGETRKVKCLFKPYRKGEQLNLVDQAEPRDPWSYPCPPTTMYKDEIKTLNIPNTDVLHMCHVCDGKEIIKCLDCKGKGCKSCANKGQTTCTACQGYLQLRWYLQAIVVYSNHTEEYVPYRSELPASVRTIVKPELLAQEEGMQVSPIRASQGGNEVAENSKRLLQKVHVSYPYEKRVKQKHSLTSVNCFECEAEYQNKPFKFWVYGSEKSVHVDKYPGDKCCCTVL